MQDAQANPQMKTEPRDWALSLSPGKMALLMTLVIFVSELCVMLLLDRFPPFSPLAEALVDSCFLIAFLVPAYVAFYRPFWQSRIHAQEEIRHLNHRLVEASEEEKRRVALDLHDYCDQTLVALQRTVELVQGKVIDTSEEAAVLCQEIDELLGRLNHDIRAVSLALHPPQLEEQGLKAALNQYIYKLESQHKGVTIELVEKGSEYPVSKQRAIAIYRIAQEALRNAIKHAQPKLVRVYLDYAPSAVSVTVVDDGKGFNPKTASEAGGVGLVSMRERARAQGGTLVVHSELARGTSLRANFKI